MLTLWEKSLTNACVATLQNPYLCKHSVAVFSPGAVGTQGTSTQLLLTLSGPSSVPGTVRNFLDEQARAGRADGRREAQSVLGLVETCIECPEPKFCFLSRVPQWVTMW